MKITVFGLGYVGLVTGVCFAEANNKVICVDCNAKKIAELKHGKLNIYEPRLHDLLLSNYKRGLLEFVTDVKYAVEQSQLIFITVAMPTNVQGDVELANIMEVAKTIGEFINTKKIIVNKSTVPVGTAYKIEQVILQELKQRELSIPFYVVSNPEFLQEGRAVYNFQNPDRIVIGTEHQLAIETMQALYSSFVKAAQQILLVDARTVEFIKYVANAMLATKISFINEIACLADKLMVDIKEVCKAISLDPRIGPYFIEPGCGYGGSSFPKDLKALINFAKQFNYEPALLQAVESINYNQKKSLFFKLKKHFNNNLHGLTIAIWGLAFKANTNDVREASSCQLMEDLWEHKVTIKAFDPQAMNEINKIYGTRKDLYLTKTKEECLVNADALVVCTEWPEFVEVDLMLLSKLLKNKVIFDGRNMFDYDLIKKYGFEYFGIGYGDRLISVKQDQLAKLGEGYEIY